MVNEMPSQIKRGESIFIPFRNGKTIYDSQNKPRMYMTAQAFEKCFPGHIHGKKGIELVEYAEVQRSKWLQHRLSVPKGKGQTYLVYGCYVCHKHERRRTIYCPNCGAKMDLEVEE